MDKKTIWWAAGVIALVAIALGLWGFALYQPLSTWTGIYSIPPWMPIEGLQPAQQTSAAAPTSALAPSIPTAKTRLDVVAIVESLPNSSEFQSLFRSTGVAAALEESGEYTVFVPTNGAFSDLPNGTIANLSAAELKRLVEYHVVAGKAIQADAETTGTIEALSGDLLNFSDTNGTPMVASATLTEEYTATDGVVYVVSGVLLPPQK